MMKLHELTNYLEEMAPLAWQESYDNSGLIVGQPDMEISSAIISLDCTEEVVEEAIQRGANLIISHHPIVFKGLKRFNGSNYVERVVMKAIRHDIAIYAIHTNLDNVALGVNNKIADRLMLENRQILAPKKQVLQKLVTYVPVAQAEEVRNALFHAGAGKLGKYGDCSFNTPGTGTFKALAGANPFVGEIGERHQEEEIRVEVLLPANIQRKVVAALKQAHPYEEVAYEILTIENQYFELGSGMVGTLAEPMNPIGFLAYLKKELNAQVIRHTTLPQHKIQKIAVCGGSGSFLLQDAIRSGADVFVTSDFKYHEFFDAEGKIVIADIGHFESEQFTQELLLEVIQKKFPTFAVRLTEKQTNPINYYI